MMLIQTETDGRREIVSNEKIMDIFADWDNEE